MPGKLFATKYMVPPLNSAISTVQLNRSVKSVISSKVQCVLNVSSVEKIIHPPQMDS